MIDGFFSTIVAEDMATLRHGLRNERRDNRTAAHFVTSWSAIANVVSVNSTANGAGRGTPDLERPTTRPQEAHPQ